MITALKQEQNSQIYKDIVKNIRVIHSTIDQRVKVNFVCFSNFQSHSILTTL